MSRRRLAWIAVGILLLAGIVLARPWYRKPLMRLLAGAPERSTGRFQDPEGMSVDAQGNIYVADEDTKTLFMLSPQGATLAELRQLPGLEGTLTDGDSMAVIAPGHLVIIGAHLLVELEIGPGRARLIRTIGRRGHADGEFEDPEGLSRDRNGDIYATDEDHRRILVFDAEGRFRRQFSVEHDPESVCVFEDRVYVTMSKGGWVGCYAKDGTLRFKFGADHLDEPDYVCVSPDRKLYVTDQSRDRIQVFDLDGRYLSTIGGSGREPGRFRQPEDLAFDPAGNLVVADGGNHRIQVLSPSGQPLRVIE